MITAPLLALLGLSLAALSATAQTNPFTAGIQTYALTMPPATWAQMQIDARQEKWERAQVSIDGVPIAGDVGLRFKGSASSIGSCFTNDVLDRIKCPRVSMKIKFTKYKGPPYVDGIETLNFHSMTKDQTKMAEKIGYKLFNDVGVATARSSWAKLTMNGGDLGLFSLVDQLDDVFVKRIDKPGDGQLYKEAWIGEGESMNYFEDKREEGSRDHSPLLTFQNAITSAQNGCRLTVLASAFDTTSLYNYLAVDALIGNWDGITGFYCRTINAIKSCSPHNFYVYRSKQNAFTFIPWDLDQTMNKNFLPLDSIPFWLNPGSCDARYPLFGASGIVAKSAGCSPIFAALAENPPAFSAAIETVLSGGFASLETEIETYRAQLAPHVDAGELVNWNGAVNELKAGLPVLRARARAYKSSAAPAVCGSESGSTPRVATPTNLPTTDCYGPGERNEGAVGFPEVLFKPCCDGQLSAPRGGDWGKFCPGAPLPTTDCYGPGERNEGAVGFPEVLFKPCCDGQLSAPRGGDWGKFCPGRAPLLATG